MPTKLATSKPISPKKSSKSSWKDVQTKNQIKRRSKIALIVLAIIIGLLAVSWSISFVRNLFSPLTKDVVVKNYRWDGNFNINFAVRTSDIAVFSYSPKDKKITLIKIPNETFVEVPRGFGLWQLQSVYGLGKGQLLKDTLTAFLGIPIDAYIDFAGNEDIKNVKQAAEVLGKNPFSGFSFTQINTDLSFWELIKLKLGMNSVRFDKLSEIDLSESSALGKDYLPDGTEIYSTDQIKLDSLLSELLDPTIVSEQKSIAVFNATGHPQLATKWARLITNMGGNVISTSNAKKVVKKTQVIGSPSMTLARLKQIFEIDCQSSPKCDNKSLSSEEKEDKISPTDEDIVSSRGQINLFLGEDYLIK